MFDFLLVRLEWLLKHKFKGHQCSWRDGADELCTGDLTCTTCNLVLWCRWLDPKWFGGHQA